MIYIIQILGGAILGGGAAALFVGGLLYSNQWENERDQQRRAKSSIWGKRR